MWSLISKSYNLPYFFIKCFLALGRLVCNLQVLPALVLLNCWKRCLLGMYSGHSVAWLRVAHPSVWGRLVVQISLALSEFLVISSSRLRNLAPLNISIGVMGRNLLTYLVQIFNFRNDLLTGLRIGLVDRVNKFFIFIWKCVEVCEPLSHAQSFLVIH